MIPESLLAKVVPSPASVQMFGMTVEDCTRKFCVCLFVSLPHIQENKIWQINY